MSEEGQGRVLEFRKGLTDAVKATLDTVCRDAPRFSMDQRKKVGQQAATIPTIALLNGFQKLLGGSQGTLTPSKLCVRLRLRLCECCLIPGCCTL